MRSSLCILLSLVCLFLGACGRSANSIQIGGQASNNSAIRLESDSLYINPALLGMDQGEHLTINTSSDNELTFDISKDSGADPQRASSAF